MERSLNNFQLVIVECPYEIWDNPLVQTIFLKMVALKRQGYGNNYDKNVLPVDTSDFIGTHVLLCIKDIDGTWKPIMGYKSISLKKCQEYNLTFPGLNLVYSAKMPQHIQAVENIVRRCIDQQQGLAYCGSWTIDVEFKKNYYQNHKDLTDATTVFYFALKNQQNINEIVLGGTLRFHTEKIFSNWGCKPISLNEQELPPIKVAHLAEEAVIVMHTSADSPVSTIATEKKWHKIWKDRIHLRPQNTADKSNKDAA
ncbi:MAG: hypothetical protein ACXVCP_11380 [Bdellovibrio sp.]